MLIDTHTHISESEFDQDREAVLERAHRAGVQKMVLVGINLQSSQRCVSLVRENPSLWATVGLHPHESHLLDEKMLKEFENLAGRERVVGIGETGLDYHYSHSTREQQRHAFLAHIDLARRKRLPLVIHSREAWPDMIEIIRQENLGEHARSVGVIFHCFTGGAALAHQLTALGFSLSFSGIVTFPKAIDLHATVAAIDSNFMLIETDCPYLTPQGFRGKRNEPSYLSHVAKKIAELRRCPVTEIADITSKNAERLFRLSDPPLA